MARKKAVDPEIEIGTRLFERRKYRGFTREDCGAAVGLTQQQIAKYEHGRSRIAASTLKELAEFLGCKPSAFLDW